MLFKLAFRNMRRSVKDYAIYFVTLIVAVVIFYAFNSITDQHVMQEIEASGHVRILDVMDMLMNMFSVVVALVLGFLIIYANQMLVARRKMEFGIYFTLGMRPGQVSRILLYETVLVGLVSLVLGLALGVFVSQFLSFASAALFGISMQEYQFDFSVQAFLMTLLSFVAIYVVVAIFNVIAIRRDKLIDLINASKKSQKVAIRNPWLCLVLFIASIGILAMAYWKLNESGIMEIGSGEGFAMATVLMLVGSLLFFFSLAGLVVAIVTKSKSFYYKKLRPFTLRQVASKVNTSFVSIWIVCVLLFLSITTFATGMNFVTMFVADIDESNPYDISILMSGGLTMNSDSSKHDNEVSSNLVNAESRFQESLPQWEENVETAAQVNIYELPEITYEQLLKSGDISLENAEMLYSFLDSPVQVASASQINAALVMSGSKVLDVEDGSCVILNNMSALEDTANAVVDNGVVLWTPSGELTLEGSVEKIQLYDFNVLATGMLFVVPDAVIEDLALHGLYPYESVIDIDLKQGANEDAFVQAIEDFDLAGVTNVLTRNEMVEQAMGLRVLITYLAIYIGLVLLIATAAVLSIQLLSVTIDSIERYRMLVKLGSEPSMVKGSLFAQVALFFMTPLSLAACHCACAITIVNKELSSLMRVGIENTLLCIAALVVIYGGYMLVTYLTSKSLVKDAWARA